jgi:hypothetical protein
MIRRIWLAGFAALLVAVLSVSVPAQARSRHPRPHPSPSASASPTASPSPTSADPPPADPPSGWPDASNTGVPDGVTLTAYSGPCTITELNTVIDAALVNCDLDIQTTGVSITRSRINGTVYSTDGSGFSFSISDSEVVIGHRVATGLSATHYVATRVEVTGGNRGAYCQFDCTIQDSWIHGTEWEDQWHASGVRPEIQTTVRHNTLACDAHPPVGFEGDCSADMTGYPDFAPPHDWTIDGNLFVANELDAAYCTFGGSSPGKPFSDDPLTGVDIKFTNNVFQRGTSGTCAAYGPVADFNPAKPGAVWSNNTWDDGTPLPTPEFP